MDLISFKNLNVNKLSRIKGGKYHWGHIAYHLGYNFGAKLGIAYDLWSLGVR